MQAVWEGLAKKKWNAEQLDILGKHFASINCFQEYRKGMQGERVMGIHTVEKLEGDIDKARELFGDGLPRDDFAIEWFHKNMINLMNSTKLITAKYSMSNRLYSTQTLSMSSQMNGKKQKTRITFFVP